MIAILILVSDISQLSTLWLSESATLIELLAAFMRLGLTCKNCILSTIISSGYLTVMLY